MLDTAAFERVDRLRWRSIVVVAPFAELEPAAGHTARISE
jgi:hypothetical protein